MIPIRADKRSMVSWKPYQTEVASDRQIADWIERDPPIWGVVTGTVSGFFALDFDGQEGCRTLREKLPDLKPHRATPSGGFHVDFELPEWLVKTSSCNPKSPMGQAYPKMDVRGEGGYINVLGRSDKGAYVWLTDDPPYPIDALPAELLSLLRGTPVASHPKRLSEEAKTTVHLDDSAVRLCEIAFAKVQGGEGRNDTGFWLACQLRDHGLHQPDAAAYMQVYVEMQLPENTKGVLEHYTMAEAKASLNQAYAQHPRPSFLNSVGIQVNNRQLADLTDQARMAVEDANNPPVLFRRGGGIARVGLDDDGLVIAELLNAETLRSRLARVADWIKITKTSEIDVFPPKELAVNMLAEPWPELPLLRGVIEAPTLRADGTLLVAHGYDEASHLWLAPNNLELPEIPDDPTDADVAAAVKLLNSMYHEFPFVDRGSRANALALLLTATLRACIPGLVPFALITAPTAGSGKTLLANMVSIVATGRGADLSVLPNDEVETRKHLTSAFLEGQQMMVFDNLSGTLSSPTLAKAITGERWNDRKLGISKNYKIQQRCVWIGTGNNVTLGGDLPRRCLQIRLDPKVARPWFREFERKQPEDWVRANRGSLLAACLIIGRAWFARGTPVPDLRPWNNFYGWQSTMAGMLSLCGVEGFLENLEELHALADPDADLWANLLTYWSETFARPATSNELVATLEDYGVVHELPAALQESLDLARGVGSKPRRLTNFLIEMSERRFNELGLRIARAGTDSHDGRILWQVVVDS